MSYIGKDKTSIATLLDMLSYSRPHDSKMERDFIRRFIVPTGARPDDFGNYVLSIGDQPSILWSSHIDTMDASERRKEISVSSDGVASLTRGKAGMCLGADDTAGIYIMRCMIESEIPGLYVFHRGEERGGLGSDWISRHNPEMLTGISHAIAFDRKGTSSVITHQIGMRCLSERCARAIASVLGMAYGPDDTGVFTDTANYVGLVPECTNLSVGYYREHGPTETLDLVHLESLHDTVCRANFSDLPVVRNLDYHDYNGFDPANGFEPANYNEPIVDAELSELCNRYPKIAAELLDDCGIDPSDFYRILRRGLY